ncbi:MAG: primosomal protein N' [Gemmatimonadota bacterium]
MTGFGLIALPLPLPEPYTYRIPVSLADRVVPGARVVVPVRNREMVGIVVAIDSPSPAMEAREILAAPDAEPSVPLALLKTAEWMSRYYGAPLGLALRTLLPGGLWGVSRVVAVVENAAGVPGGTGADVLAWLEKKGGESPVTSLNKAFRKPMWDTVNRLARVGAISLRVDPPDAVGDIATERVVSLGGNPLTLVERESLFKRAPRQRKLYEVLEELGGTASARHLKEQLGFSDSVIGSLLDRALISIEKAERVRDPFAGEPSTPPPTHPNADQQEALRQIAQLQPGESALLFGVTGSGKTYVYLEAIRHALALGRGAILLVPEIGLTPQTVARVRGAFGDQVAVLHSGLSDGERADAWRLLRRGERRVAVGARSAVFAPVENLGLIVIDEEHEASYKNGETPRYHAREVAAVRAKLENACLLLGSATPSPETMTRLGPGVSLVRLPARIGDRPMPKVELIDMRSAARVNETGAVPWSVDLDEAVGSTLARKEQVLLLLNRRGFATFLQCPDCGEVKQCPHCSISLTVHHTPHALRCHYCGYEATIPPACEACGGLVQQMRGVGTQQLERMLAARFPEARVSRMDLDTTSTKWSHHRILGAVERGEVDILLGTQMIAKGLDFPNVTLVGVVDADTGLHLPDFRAAERTFQLLAQVAGRAGRGPKGGRVLVQTRNPSHHALIHAAEHDPEAFLKEELANRESPPYPPGISLANLVISGELESAVTQEALRVTDWITQLIDRHGLPVMVLGPAPCPLARIKQRWRWHVVLKGASEEIGKVVRYASSRITSAGDVRVVIDRDPVSLL